MPKVRGKKEARGFLKWFRSKKIVNLCWVFVSLIMAAASTIQASVHTKGSAAFIFGTNSLAFFPLYIYLYV